MSDYYDVPIAIKRDARTTFEELRKLAYENNATVSIEKDEDLEFHLRGLGGNSIFHFKVRKPELNKGRINYVLNYAPYNIATIERTNIQANSSTIISLSKTWLNMLIENNNPSIHSKDSITDQYENEFLDWFEIVDEDADTKAFDTPRQILISNIIDQSIEALKKEGIDEKDPLIQDAEKLKSDIPKLTKSQVFREIKTLYAKLKLKGLDKLKLVYDVCEKEVIKMGFHLGTKMLGEQLASLIETITN